MKVIVLCSGGMDSVTALHWARREHDVRLALSFDYGAKHNARELPMAAEQARRLGVAHEVAGLDFVRRLFRSALLEGGSDIPEGHYADETMRQTVNCFSASFGSCASSTSRPACVMASRIAGRSALVSR